MAVIVRGYRTGTAWPRVTRSVVTPPTETVFTVEDVKVSSRVTNSNEDTVLLDFLQAATAKVERDTGLALLTQTLDLVYDGFPIDYEGIDLPIAPVQSIGSVKYVDADGDTVTVSAADYILSGTRIGLADTASWATDTRGYAPVTIRVVAGYTSPDLVPADLKQAVRLVFGWLVEHREPAKFERGMYDDFVTPHKRTLVA